MQVNPISSLPTSLKKKHNILIKILIKNINFLSKSFILYKNNFLLFF